MIFLAIGWEICFTVGMARQPNMPNPKDCSLVELCNHFLLITHTEWGPHMNFDLFHPGDFLDQVPYFLGQL